MIYGHKVLCSLVKKKDVSILLNKTGNRRASLQCGFECAVLSHAKNEMSGQKGIENEINFIGSVWLFI